MTDATPSITRATEVVAAKGQVASELAGEVVLLSLDSGMYYGLDQVGARIWQLVQEPTTAGAIHGVLVSEYDVEPDRCWGDLLGLLQALTSAGLIETRDGTDTA